MNDHTNQHGFAWAGVPFGLASVVLGFLWAQQTLAAVYVDPHATGANDGSSWQDAYNDLHEALRNTENDEIWVAAAVYSPSEPGGDRSAAFELKDGVALYGGFSGNETRRDQRDPEAHPTVLSGDLDGDDAVRWVNGHFAWQYAGNNSTHVVVANGVDETAVLDGFEIGHGFAYGNQNGFYGTAGGGLLIRDASPTLANLRFSANAAQLGGAVAIFNGRPNFANSIFYRNYADIGKGGAVYNDGSSATVFADCTFRENTAIGSDITEGLGGAIVNYVDGRLSVFRSSFIGNRTGYRTYSYADDYQTRGGAIATYGDTLIQDSTFLDNEAHGGGAIYSYRDLTVVNSVFSGNSAMNIRWVGIGWTGLGGAILGLGKTHLINTTVSGNRSTDNGGGMYSGGNTLVENSIFWGNEVSKFIAPGDEPIPTVKQQLHKGAGGLDISYSDVQGLLQPIPGEDPPDPANFPGSIDVDPRFVHARGADNRFGTEDDDLHLAAYSPAIDAGDNVAIPAGVTADLDGNPRRSDDITTPDSGNGMAPIVDMGAYELVGIVADPGDLEAPVASITAPGNGEALSGVVLVSADAYDNVGINHVEFFVDGQFLASSNTGPYHAEWDTSGVSNGTHSIQVKAYDGAGNVGASSVVTVMVDNAAASGGGAGAPQPAANAEEVSIKGEIEEVGGDYILVSGSTIYYSDETLMTFEDGTGGIFAVGQQAEVMGLRNPDGVVIATEIQIQP